MSLRQVVGQTSKARYGIDKHRERTLLGSLTNSYKFKPDGLMKKVRIMLFKVRTIFNKVRISAYHVLEGAYHFQ